MPGSIDQVNLAGSIAPSYLVGTIAPTSLLAIIAPSYIYGTFAPYVGKDKHRTIQTNINTIISAVNFLIFHSVINNYNVPVADAEALDLALLMMAIGVPATVNVSISPHIDNPTLSMDSVIPAPQVATVIS